MTPAEYHISEKSKLSSRDLQDSGTAMTFGGDGLPNPHEVQVKAVAKVGRMAGRMPLNLVSSIMTKDADDGTKRKRKV